MKKEELDSILKNITRETPLVEAMKHARQFTDAENDSFWGRIKELFPEWEMLHNTTAAAYRVGISPPSYEDLDDKLAVLLWGQLGDGIGEDHRNAAAMKWLHEHYSARVVRAFKDTMKAWT